MLSKVYIFSFQSTLRLIYIAIQDHFGLILNEPAGKIAQVVVEHTVNLIVQVGFAYPPNKRQVD